MIRDAQLLVRSVHGQCKTDGLVDFVHEALETGQPADGRDRRATVRDAEVGKPSRGCDDLVEVEASARPSP